MDANEVIDTKESASGWQWFSTRFKAFVSRVNRRMLIRIVRLWRSIQDVLTCFGSGLPVIYSYGCRRILGL